MQTNDIVENFTLQDQDGHHVSLSDFAGSPVVLVSHHEALVATDLDEVQRLLKKKGDALPYFDKATEAELVAFGADAVADRDASRLDRFPSDASLRARLVRPAPPAEASVIGNWLSYLATQKG